MIFLIINVLLKIKFYNQNLPNSSVVHTKNASVKTGEKLCHMTVNDCYIEGMYNYSGDCNMINNYCKEIISVLSMFSIWHENDESKQYNSNVK